MREGQVDRKRGAEVGSPGRGRCLNKSFVIVSNNRKSMAKVEAKVACGQRQLKNVGERDIERKEGERVRKPE